MGDIALGLKEAGLVEFAAQRNAAHMGHWEELGLYEDAEGWGDAFRQAVTKTLKADCHIHFNLTGMDIAEALRGDPEIFVGRYTSYELQQVLLHEPWFHNTTFYLDGESLTIEQLRTLGITPPTS
jgi:hypothetical protein